MPRKTLLVEMERIDGRLASMRPRPDAAENSRVTNDKWPAAVASMRPRPDAAENLPNPALQPQPPARFNEAAARCRGKPRPGCGRGSGRRSLQ